MKILLLTLSFVLCSSFEFSQSDLKVAYQGFHNGGYLFFLKQCSGDTIKVKRPLYFGKYNDKCMCYHIEKEYYSIVGRTIEFHFKYFENTVGMYIADAKEGDFTVDNLNFDFNNGKSNGIRLYPAGMSKRKAGNLNVKIVYEGLNLSSDTIYFKYPDFKCE